MLRRSVLIAAVGLALSSPLLGVQRPLIVTSQEHSLVTIDDCAHFSMRTTSSLPSQAQGEEQRAVPLAGIGTLRINASAEGGVSVRGWDRPVARLTICKYAVALTQVDAERTLRDVVVTVHNGEINPRGPEAETSRTWWVHLILRVPRSSAVDVSSANGGIAIRNMSGRVTARATNGGISLTSCDGNSRISTENGGISLENITGQTEASTRNGPISIKIQSGSSRPTIEARTEGAYDIRCRAKICAESQPMHGGGSRFLRIGGALPVVRLSTGNAPILIEQVR